MKLIEIIVAINSLITVKLQSPLPPELPEDLELVPSFLFRLSSSYLPPLTPFVTWAQGNKNIWPGLATLMIKSKEKKGLVVKQKEGAEVKLRTKHELTPCNPLLTPDPTGLVGHCDIPPGNSQLSLGLMSY